MCNVNTLMYIEKAQHSCRLRILVTLSHRLAFKMAMHVLRELCEACAHTVGVFL